MVAILHRKWFIIIATAATTTLFVLFVCKPTAYQPIEVPIIYERESIEISDESFNAKRTVLKNWRGLTKNDTAKMSVLARVLYLNEEPPKVADRKDKYRILVWKYGKTTESRHLKNFGKDMIDPFEDCSMRNCEIAFADGAVDGADIVIFHLHRMKLGELPKRGSQTQIWAFLTDESPNHTFLNPNNLTMYNGVFNWSMTYRMDSDIPVPYGRTVIRRKPLEENLTFDKRKDVLVAILGSNCGGKNKRWEYIKELQKYITVDTYGGCGKLKTCPGHFRSDCPDIEKYLFYLAFENSNCDEYVTEKLWWNAYAKNSIPIVMGATKESYRKLLPPNSYLNVDDYAQPKDLANHILYLNSTGKYRDLYKWKYNFQVLNEHGYFKSKSYHYCRVCEALNYNDKSVKTYTDLSQFWSVSRDCHPAWNA